MPTNQNDDKPIFGKILKAIDASQALTSTTPTVIFIGEKEWKELGELLETFDVPWRGGAPDYNPAQHEENRAEFKGLKIYRVDAKSFLIAN